MVLGLVLQEHVGRHSRKTQVRFKSMGKNFRWFIVIVGVLELGNSSDAFIILRARRSCRSSAFLPC